MIEVPMKIFLKFVPSGKFTPNILWHDHIRRLSKYGVRGMSVQAWDSSGGLVMRSLWKLFLAMMALLSAGALARGIHRSGMGRLWAHQVMHD